MADKDDQVLRACVAEGIGTFALCFIGGGAICTDAYLAPHGPGLLGIALAHGLILSIAVTAAMNVSGGHINPAVTVAMMVVRRISVGRGLAYILSQLAGGILGGAMLYVAFSDLGTRADSDLLVIAKAGLGTPHFDLGTASAPQAAIIEAMLTFILLFAVFGTAVDPRHPNVGGFGVGLAIACDILVGGPLTGAAMNPARVVGTGVFSGLTDFWAQQWVYWAGPCGGAILAALAYEGMIIARRSPASPTPPPSSTS